MKIQYIQVTGIERDVSLAACKYYLGIARLRRTQELQRTKRIWRLNGTKNTGATESTEDIEEGATEHTADKCCSY